MELKRLRQLAGLITEATWNGHEIIANRKTPNGEFIVVKNKNDGKYEIHKKSASATGGYEFVSAQKTPAEMQVAFKKVAGVD
jgi:hypothetical protein